MPGADADPRFQRGWDTLLELTRGKRPAVVDEVAQTSPDLAEMIVAFGYGDAYTRPALAPRERQLVTIGILTALGGCEAQVEVHAATALNVGVTPEELVEVIIHSVPFCGFPKALNALGAVRSVLDRRGIELPVAPPTGG